MSDVIGGLVAGGLALVVLYWIGRWFWVMLDVVVGQWGRND